MLLIKLRKNILLQEQFYSNFYFQFFYFFFFFEISKNKITEGRKKKMKDIYLLEISTLLIFVMIILQLFFSKKSQN